MDSTVAVVVQEEGQDVVLMKSNSNNKFHQDKMNKTHKM
jgi:hypothetical protein